VEQLKGFEFLIGIELRTQWMEKLKINWDGINETSGIAKFHQVKEKRKNLDRR
jgi:hypothetical protein